MFENIKEFIFGTTTEEKLDNAKQSIEKDGGTFVEGDKVQTPVGKLVTFIVSFFKQDDTSN